MKKIIFLPIFCILFSLTINAQRLTKHEANQLFEKTISYLKTNDTASFINLSLLDDAPYPYHSHAFTVKGVKANFEELQKFMDTALTQNMKIDYVEIEKQDADDKTNYFAKYKIKAWFEYSKTYEKGFGFYVDYVNGKWMYRFSPDYSQSFVVKG